MNRELQVLGLNYYESKVVEVLLKDPHDLRSLSKKSSVPFGKIYSIVKSLKEKAIVQETNSRPKLIYIDNASEVIARLIKSKQDGDAKTIDTIRSRVIELDKLKGKTPKFFQIGTTNEHNKCIQLRTYQEAEKEVLQIINIHHKPKSNRTNKTLWEKEIIASIQRGVIYKAIYPKKTKLPDLLGKLNKKHPNKFQVKRHDTDFTRCDIIDGKKVLIKFVQQDPIQPGGVLFIEDEKLAHNMKNIFYELWRHST